MAALIHKDQIHKHFCFNLSLHYEKQKSKYPYFQAIEND
jgi:hypothetical protein